MKLSLIASALLVSTLANAKPLSYQDANNNLAPLYLSPEAEVIAKSYIVVLKNHLSVDDIKEHAGWIKSISSSSESSRQKLSDWLNPHAATAGIEHVYDTPNLKGYSGKFDDNVLEAIRQSEDVSAVI